MTRSKAAFAPRRQERLLRIVATRRAVRVEDLREALGVSPATIRRDLDVLQEAGRLRRVHGGAVALDVRPVEPLFEAKAAVNSDAKLGIARLAASLIEPGDTIYIDSGSTCLELARVLAGRVDLTVVSNSLPAIAALAARGSRVVAVGGEVRPLSQAIVGPLSGLLLEALYVDRAFMGTFGLSLEAGLTTSDPQEAFTKELVLSRARQVVLLADAGKMGTRSFAHAGRLDQVDVLVTDAPLDEGARRAFAEAEVRVLVA